MCSEFYTTAEDPAVAPISRALQVPFKALNALGEESGLHLEPMY